MMCITSISNTQQTAVSRLAVIIATAIAIFNGGIRRTYQEACILAIARHASLYIASGNCGFTRNGSSDKTASVLAEDVGVNDCQVMYPTITTHTAKQTNILRIRCAFGIEA